MWASKLQTEVALSTTEAEYNALSTSLREVIYLMQLVEEANNDGWQTHEGPPTVHCKVFEDNIGALEMARLPKMRPRTKHLCVRLHHFREHVRKKLITIQHIATDLQIADLLTKPQPKALFVQQRQTIMCWPVIECSEQAVARDTGSTSDITSEPIHLRACGISEFPVGHPYGIYGGQTESEKDNISMNEVPDVSTGSSHDHEELSALSRKESNGSSEQLDNNNQDNEGQNGPRIQATLEDLSDLEDQIYRNEDFGVKQRAKEAAAVENAYTVVQKKRRMKKKSK